MWHARQLYEFHANSGRKAEEEIRFSNLVLVGRKAKTIPVQAWRGP